MGDINWQKVEQIVDAILDLPAEQHYAYIEQTCGHDQRLKSEVTQLIESIFDSEGWLKDLKDHKYEFYNDFSEDLKSLGINQDFIGRQVGSYTIEEKIGQGGMGLIYLAQRTDDNFDHQVAIKIIRDSQATEKNIQRFQREQRILAGLNHPGIAQLYDGGVTDDGAPYIIMEYVRGIPIIEYCRTHNCSIEERIDLFKQVLEAVRYAHENLVIHRDLKPDNILVDESGKVKILDFGISKLLHDENDLSLTQTGARILTPKYAAPEQIKQTNITTATDLYSLGLIFYEILSNKPPFDLDDCTTYQAEQIILNQDPAKPSTKVSDPKVKKNLQGDLNAITLKAIRKEPRERYRVANEFLDDLNNYLKELPVSARTNSFQYRTSKFFGRHKHGIAATTAFIALIVTFAGFYTIQIAEERNQARVEAQKAREVSNFLTDMYRASNPMYETDKTVSATDLLQRGEKRINQLDAQPAIQAQLLGVMGRAYENLAQFDKARSLFNRSLAIRKQLHPPNHPDIAEGLSYLAVFNRKIGNFSTAESLHSKALTIRKSSLGESHIKTSQSLNDLAVVLGSQGKYEASESYLNKALRIKEKVHGKNHHEVARVLSNIASNKRYLGHYEEADKLFQEAIDIWKSVHEINHPDVAEGIHDLALIKDLRGKFDEADSLYRQSLKIYRNIYEEPHPTIALNLNNLGTFLGKNGYYDKAQPFLEQSLEMRRTIYNDTHPDIAGSLNNLGRLYIETGKYQQAKSLLEEALKIDMATYGAMHPYVGGDLKNIGLIFKKEGNYQKAEEYFSKSLNIFEQRLPKSHKYVTETLTNLGEVLIHNNSIEDAQEILYELLEIQNKTQENEHWKIARTKVLLGISLFELNKFDMAEPLLQNSYDNLRITKGLENEYAKRANHFLKKIQEKSSL